MSVALMHHLHSETCSVKNVSPGVNDVTVRRLDGLVEVEAKSNGKL